jgi:hypothetical protein
MQIYLVDISKSDLIKKLGRYKTRPWVLEAEFFMAIGTFSSIMALAATASTRKWPLFAAIAKDIARGRTAPKSWPELFLH